MTGGRLIAVVGPSGVGKDSVMRAVAAAAPEFTLVRRAITRPAGFGGEGHDAMSPAEFEKQREQGAFCLHWSAHGLSYGIPRQAATDVGDGKQLLVNLSRGALDRAATAFPNLVVLNLTARPEILAARLAARGRESEEEIRRRLARRLPPLPAGLDIRELSNDGPIVDTVRQALGLLQAERGRRSGKPTLRPKRNQQRLRSDMTPPDFPEPPAQPTGNQATGSLCLSNARLVLPDRIVPGAIVIEDGVIAEIVEGDARPGPARDCGGAYVLPGLIELHTDNLERHIEPRPAVDWPHDSAILAHDGELASAGITTVFDAMRVGSIHGEKSRYPKYARSLSQEMFALRAGGALKISHFLHLRAEICSETLLEELAEFTPGDRVGIVSLMDHTPGQRQFRDIDKLKNYVSKRRGMNDVEIEDHIAKLVKLRALNGDRHETGAVAAAKRLGAVLASHDDTTRDQVATSHGHGVRFAEFPTTVEAARACRDQGIAIVLGAPNLIRGGSHSGNVSALDLADAGLLDIVSSDYVPSALLLSAFRLGARWRDLPRAVRTVTEAPARATGLSDRGALKTGLRGDIICVSELNGTPIVRAVWSRGRQIG